jgi:hypothetical protein
MKNMKEATDRLSRTFRVSNELRPERPTSLWKEQIEQYQNTASVSQTSTNEIETPTQTLKDTPSTVTITGEETTQEKTQNTKDNKQNENNAEGPIQNDKQTAKDFFFTDLEDEEDSDEWFKPNQNTTNTNQDSQELSEKENKTDNENKTTRNHQTNTPKS